MSRRTPEELIDLFNKYISEKKANKNVTILSLSKEEWTDLNDALKIHSVTYYDLLGLEFGASKEDVRSEYVKRILLVHPDKVRQNWNTMIDQLNRQGALSHEIERTKERMKGESTFCDSYSKLIIGASDQLTDHDSKTAYDLKSKSKPEVKVENFAELLSILKSPGDSYYNRWRKQEAWGYVEGRLGDYIKNEKHCRDLLSLSQDSLPEEGRDKILQLLALKELEELKEEINQIIMQARYLYSNSVEGRKSGKEILVEEEKELKSLSNTKLKDFTKIHDKIVPVLVGYCKYLDPNKALVEILTKISQKAIAAVPKIAASLLMMDGKDEEGVAKIWKNLCENTSITEEKLIAIAIELAKEPKQTSLRVEQIEFFLDHPQTSQKLALELLSSQPNEKLNITNVYSKFESTETLIEALKIPGLTKDKLEVLFEQSFSQNLTVETPDSEKPVLEAFFSHPNCDLSVLQTIEKKLPNNHDVIDQLLKNKNTDVTQLKTFSQKAPSKEKVKTFVELKLAVLKKLFEYRDTIVKDSWEGEVLQAERRRERTGISGSLFGGYSTETLDPTVTKIKAQLIREALRKVCESPDENEQPAVHRIMPISLTVDHRAVTGGEAARFLAGMIENLSS